MKIFKTVLLTLFQGVRSSYLKNNIANKKAAMKKPKIERNKRQFKYKRMKKNSTNTHDDCNFESSRGMW